MFNIASNFINSMLEMEKYQPGYIIIYILCYALSTFTFYIFFKRTLTLKFKASYTILASIILDIIMLLTTTNLNIYSPYEWLYNIAFFFLFSLIFFNGNFSKKIVTVITFVCFNEITQYVTIPFIFIAHYVDNIYALRIVLLHLSNMGSFVLNFLVLNFISKHLYIKNNFKNIRYTIIFIIPNIFITLILCVYLTTYYPLNKEPPNYLPGDIKMILISSLGLVCSIITVFTLDKLLEANFARERQLLLNQQFNVQVEHCKKLQTQFETSKSFRHDIKNHLICVKNLISNGDIEDAVLYIEKITNSVENLSLQISTHNPIADAVISEKCSICMSNNIEFNCLVNIPQNSQLDPFDLCVILSNALDNSLEACKKITDAKILKYVHIKSSLNKNFLLFEIENSVQNYIDKTNLITNKDDSSNHGLGLLNIKNTANKYNGTINIETTNNKFVLTVMLQI